VRDRDPQLLGNNEPSESPTPWANICAALAATNQGSIKLSPAGDVICGIVVVAWVLNRQSSLKSSGVGRARMPIKQKVKRAAPLPPAPWAVRTTSVVALPSLSLLSLQSVDKYKLYAKYQVGGMHDTNRTIPYSNN
jgi:hypothetical protein